MVWATKGSWFDSQKYLDECLGPTQLLIGCPLPPYVFIAWCLIKRAVVGIASSYELDGRGVGDRVLVWDAVRTGSGAHPASYSVGGGGSFLRGKSAGTKICTFN
jgi:hypothetical protein